MLLPLPNPVSEPPVILGIESSCDETAAAIVAGPFEVRSNVIATQHNLHQRYAGVVPEIASRAHLERIMPVIRDALKEAKLTLADIDAIAVGNRPGLIGSLLVGVSAAKALAWARGLPLIGVDHIHAHLHAAALGSKPIRYPALGLVVSGGHTTLFHQADALTLSRLGRTIDDAIGEAFDKAATILELGYPGGPEIDRLAAMGDDHAHEFPISSLGRDSLDFSFSGLKTALLYAVRGMPANEHGRTVYPKAAADLSDAQRADFAASFQRAAVTAILRKCKRALDQIDGIQSLVVGGGVSANRRLREELRTFANARSVELRLPAMEHCLDNAAMIAGLAAVRFEAAEFDDFSLAAAARSEV